MVRYLDEMGGRGGGYRRAGRRPKKVTKTMNEMPSTTRAMVAMVPISAAAWSMI